MLLNIEADRSFEHFMLTPDNIRKKEGRRNKTTIQ